MLGRRQQKAGLRERKKDNGLVSSIELQLSWDLVKEKEKKDSECVDM